MDWLTVARKLLPYAVAFVIGATLVGGSVWMIQGARVDSAKAELSETQANLRISQNNEKACEDSNKINQATIGGLQEEVRSSLQGCDSRLAVKDKTLKNLKRISELKGGTDEKVENGSTVNSSGDPFLDELNRMFIPPGGGPGPGNDGIRPAAGTGPAR